MWVIGIINRTRDKLWIEVMPNRRKKTIQRILNPLFKEGWITRMKVFTDALTSYEYLKEKHHHHVINKAVQGFGRRKLIGVDTYLHINVNTIENNWMLLRKHLTLRNAYIHPTHMAFHIAEYMHNFYQLDWFDLIRIQ